MPKSAKAVKSTRVDPALLRRVRLYLGAKTDGEAIAKAIASVDEERLLHEFLAKHAGTLSASDWDELRRS